MHIMIAIERPSKRHRASLPHDFDMEEEQTVEWMQGQVHLAPATLPQHGMNNTLHFFDIGHGLHTLCTDIQYQHVKTKLLVHNATLIQALMQEGQLQEITKDDRRRLLDQLALLLLDHPETMLHLFRPVSVDLCARLLLDFQAEYGLLQSGMVWLHAVPLLKAYGLLMSTLPQIAEYVSDFRLFVFIVWL